MIIADSISPDLACLWLLKHLQLPSELCFLTTPYGLVCLRAFVLSRSTGMSATIRALARFRADIMGLVATGPQPILCIVDSQRMMPTTSQHHHCGRNSRENDDDDVTVDLELFTE